MSDKKNKIVGFISRLTAVLVCVLLETNTVGAVNVDSLIRALSNSKEDTAKVRLYDQIVGEYLRNDTKKAFRYIKMQEELVEKLNYEYGRYLVLFNYSECFFWFGEYDKMLDVLKKNDALIEKLKLGKEKNTQIVLYARYYNKTNQKEKAITKFIQAIDFYRKTNNRKMLAATLTSFAVFYTEIGDHEKAKKYFLESYRIHQSMNNLSGISTIYINLGETYYYLNQIDSAQFFLEKCLEIQEKIKDRRSIATAKSNLGSIYIEKGYYDQALVLFKESYDDFLYLGDTTNMAISKLLCADVFIETKDFNSAIPYINEALILMERQNALPYKRYAYSSLILIYEKTGDYRKALDAYKKVSGIDSLIQEEQTSLRIKEIEKKYETKKLEKEISLMQEKDKIKDLLLMKNESDINARNYFVMVLILMLIIISFGGYFIYRQNKMKQQKKAAELEHTALRAQMNPHFIFNALNSIQRMYIEGEIDSANEFMGEFAELMRRILDNSHKNSITLHEEISTLILYMDLEKVRCKNKFEYSLEIDKSINEYKVLIPPLVFQPFVENAIWHGIVPKKQNGYINISINTEKDKLKCVVTDDGVGVSNENNKQHESKGIHITELRLGNKVFIVSKKGIGTTVTFYINYTI